MTVLEMSHDLYDWFKNHDSFEMERDFKKIVLISIDESEDKSLLLASLDGLEKVGVVKLQALKTKKYWFLSKPIASFEQSVSINGAVAAEISLIVNGFCHKINDKTDLSDPLNITPKDIRNLVLICGHYQKELTSP